MKKLAFETLAFLVCVEACSSSNTGTPSPSTPDSSASLGSQVGDSAAANASAESEAATPGTSADAAASDVSPSSADSGDAGEGSTQSDAGIGAVDASSGADAGQDASLLDAGAVETGSGVDAGHAGIPDASDGAVEATTPGDSGTVAACAKLQPCCPLVAVISSSDETDCMTVIADNVASACESIYVTFLGELGKSSCQ